MIIGIIDIGSLSTMEINLTKASGWRVVEIYNSASKENLTK